MSRLFISEKCNGCGGCEGYGFVEEQDNGKFTVKSNLIIDDSNIGSINEMIDECPCKAITLQDKDEKPLTKKDFIADIIRRLEKVDEIPDISSDDIEFNTEDYSVNEVRGPEGEAEYVYRTYSAAQRAAEDEFRSMMWSHTESLMQELIVKYRYNVLGKYYDMSNEDNIFVKKNQEIEAILQSACEYLERYGIRKEDLQSKYSEQEHQIFGVDRDDTEWFTFDIDPFRYDAWMASNGGYVNSILEASKKKYGDRKYNFQDHYGYKLDIDGMEVCERNGLFGRERFVKRYAYMGLYDCCAKLRKDIINAVAWSGLSREAAHYINGRIENYNKDMHLWIEKRAKCLRTF